MAEWAGVLPRARGGREGAGTAARPRPAGRRRVRLPVLEWYKPAFCLVAFFLGRAILFGELSPFVPAFAGAAVQAFGPRAWLAVAASLLGQATVLHGAALAQALLTVAALGLLLRVASRETASSWWTLPVLTAAPLIVIKTSFAAFGGGTLYSYVAVLLEGLLAGGLAHIFYHAFTCRARPLSGEQLFYLLVVAAGVIAGAGNLAYQMVTLKGVLSKLAILLAAALGGVGAGAAAGAVVGVIPGIAFTGAPAVAGVYAFAGLVGGVGRRYGRPGVAVGFLLGSILLAVSLNEPRGLAGALVEAGVAAAVLALLPRGWLSRLRELLPAGALGGGMDERVKELVRTRVGNWARMFSELSRTFAQVSSPAPELAAEKSLDELLHEVGHRICGDCTLYRSCWQRELPHTRRHLIANIPALEATGRLRPEDLPEDIRKRCVRLKELAVGLGCLYETYRVNQYWYRRLVESREVVAEHLRGVANIMQNLSAELCATAEHAELIDNRLRRKLSRLDVPVNRLEAAPREDGRLEITISCPPCRGELACRYIVAPVVSKVMGQPYAVSMTSCTKMKEAPECTFKLRPALHFRVETGVANVGKDGGQVSGDTYSCLDLPEGKFAMLLSDGMGVGPQAALESGTTISLLEQLFESGFGQDMAVRTVNSILLLRAPDETFATVDITIVDLYSGQAELVKIGAPPSFILSGGAVRVIRGASPPAGILKDIEVSSITRGLAEGDVIVMVTDGLLDVLPGADKEARLTDLIRSLGPLAPQEMADRILLQAQDAAGGLAPDDMTVLVGRIDRLRGTR
ncbi:MAG: stage II sporulation protein E [Thermoanaerobacterales bacterium]|nr:stage II sporulation protein E [Thermoanaerobacterales bacterium]